MTIVPRTILLLLVVILLLGFLTHNLAWCDSEKRAEGAPIEILPALDVTEAIELARTVAKKEFGKDIQNYYLQSVEYSARLDHWRIFFFGTGRVLQFGDCFDVFVQDKTKEVRVRRCP